MGAGAILYVFAPRGGRKASGASTRPCCCWATPHLPGLKAEAGCGRYYLPDVRDTRFNKYGMPAYHQLNASLSYARPPWLPGLRGLLLYVWKDALG
ncbi:hypothetical protein GCM10011495_02630 [Hymenobacter frigidus]|uniref:Uncharacterized protein n=1 Tax=Hymenobacter frigidus TaxID=1524095 RepID=A0ABQ1ZW82_9BACT|nr:hypothetical protein GCM10011495_02630 [Hymenobacter frigidus]